MNLEMAAPARFGPVAILLPPLLAWAAGTLLRYGLYEATQSGAGFGQYLRAICVLDCDWYETIVRGGYDLTAARHDKGDGANWAFFPLLPLLVAGLAPLLGGDVLAAAFVISTLATLATAVLAYPWLAARPRAYGLFCIFLFIGPFSFHFSTLYTESLFMALTLLGFLALHRGDYVGAGFAGALLSATRVSGVFLSLAIGLQALLDARKGGGSWWQILARLLRRGDVVFGITLAPMGLFGFMVFLHHHIGDALAFSHIQRSWGRELGNPLAYLWNGLARPPGPGQWIGFNQAWAIMALVGFGLCAELLRRRQWAMALFCALTLITPLMTEIFSMTRFVVGLAPLMVVAMTLLATWRWLSVLAALAFIAADIALLPQWIAASYYLM
jgi:hypothetical protein